MSSAPAAALLLRHGSAADIDAVAPVMAAAFDPRFGEAWTAGQLLGMLSLPGVWMTLAFSDGACLGFALSRVVVDDAELLLLATRPEHRRHGIGAALLTSAIDEASRRGGTRIHLEMRAGNPADRLYARHGFVHQATRRDYYRGAGGERFDAHSFTRALP